MLARAGGLRVRVNWRPSRDKSRPLVDFVPRDGGAGPDGGAEPGTADGIGDQPGAGPDAPSGNRLTSAA